MDFDGPIFMTFYTQVCIETITGMWGLIFLLGVKIIHLVDRTDLFKISDLVLGGEAIVTDFYSSLKEQRGRKRK
jgi:hypothetical protein